MFKRLSQSIFEHSISSAYTQRFKRKGASAEGVFWASKITQIARFEHALSQLSMIFGKSNSYQLADIGCGYGALYDFIRATPRYHLIDYYGIDINTSLIKHCQNQFNSASKKFRRGRYPVKPVDACVFIGTFNLCHTDDYALWEDYICQQIAQSWKQTKTAMVVNMTSLKQPQIRNDIFYAEPERFASMLQHHFGDTVFSTTRYLTDDTSFVVRR